MLRALRLVPFGLVAPVVMAITAVLSWGLDAIAAFAIGAVILGLSPAIVFDLVVGHFRSRIDRMRGDVLKAAKVRVHGIYRARAPRRPELENAALEWFILDVGVTPKPGMSALKHWAPDQLTLILQGRPDPRGRLLRRTWGRVYAIQGPTGDVTAAGETPPLVGPQRLRLLVGVRPGAPDLAFRYFARTLGRIPFTRVAPRPALPEGPVRVPGGPAPVKVRGAAPVERELQTSGY